MDLGGKVVSGALVVAGAIHLLPLAGVLGAEKLTALYGIPIQDASLVILMRHRAVLFGLLGAFLVYGAFRPALQPLALVAGLVSVVSFLGLAWVQGGRNAAIATIVAVDVVALVCLLVAAGLVALRGR